MPIFLVVLVASVLLHYWPAKVTGNNHTGKHTDIYIVIDIMICLIRIVQAMSQDQRLTVNWLTLLS